MCVSMKISMMSVLIAISLFSTGCGVIKLTDIDKSSNELQLTKHQREKIEPKMKLIRDIEEDYNFEKNQLEGDIREYRTLRNDRDLYRYDGGLSTQQRRRGLTEIRSKVRNFISQRNMLLKEIEKLLREIHNELSDEQRETFTILKLPELEIPRALRRDPHADLKNIPRHLIGVQ